MYCVPVTVYYQRQLIWAVLDARSEDNEVDELQLFCMSRMSMFAMLLKYG